MNKSIQFGQSVYGGIPGLVFRSKIRQREANSHRKPENHHHFGITKIPFEQAVDIESREDGETSQAKCWLNFDIFF